MHMEKKEEKVEQAKSERCDLPKSSVKGSSLQRHNE
ncbi:hypothetical protein T06_8158 [Trichinella sp. T6]|nr:hypothetical protein T06_8158 [Trichinella sp. T6]